jgi:RNA polymerase sigma-70 factor (ECF subfamily)
VLATALSHEPRESVVRPNALSDSDASLVDRCLAGDETAWSELVSRHARRVFGIVYRFVGRVDEAEDLAQEVFVRVYQSLRRYRASEGQFGTWLSTVARNLAIDNYRRHREEKLRQASELTELERMPGREESPLRAIERQERAEIVRRGIRALPLDLREPILLCDLQSLPYEEAAQSLGIPLGTLKSRLNRGRLELARRLTGRLGSAP